MKKSPHTSEIRARVFLVGCPRSGTTLLQSLLTAHPQIASFPESHVLPEIVANRPLFRRVGVATSKAQKNFAQVLHTLGLEHLQHHKPKVGVFTKEYVRSFVKVLDEATLQQGKDVWLEKTPRHLHYVESIEASAPSAKFIHIIRNGSDVVASLYEVTHKHAEVWGGPRDIDRCISRWLQDVQLSKENLQKPNHLLVRYEDLVEETKATLESVCTFVGVPFTKSMLSDYQNASEKVLAPGETWKASVQQPISNANSKKFVELFSPEQREYILERISAMQGF